MVEFLAFLRRVRWKSAKQSREYTHHSSGVFDCARRACAKFSPSFVCACKQKSRWQQPFSAVETDCRHTHQIEIQNGISSDEDWMRFTILIISDKMSKYMRGERQVGRAFEATPAAALSSRALARAREPNSWSFKCVYARYSYTHVYVHIVNLGWILPSNKFRPLRICRLVRPCGWTCTLIRRLKK